MNPKFKSNFEQQVWSKAQAQNLELRYEPFSLDYSIHARYFPDFVLPNGIIVECKGVLDQADRRKMAAVKVNHPFLDIRFCFMKHTNKLVKNGKMTYSGWAERNGFPWAETSIPLEWWKEPSKV